MFSPTLSYLIPPLYVLSFCLCCCVALDANLYICSSAAVARRGRCVCAVFAPAPPPLVLADVAAAVVFACDPLAPQSLHLLLCRWCSQRPLPPQSLHRLLCRWHLRAPAAELCRWCSQKALPAQSLTLAPKSRVSILWFLAGWSLCRFKPASGRADGIASTAGSLAEVTVHNVHCQEGRSKEVGLGCLIVVLL